MKTFTPADAFWDMSWTAMRDDTLYVICTACDRPSTDAQSLGNRPRAEIPTVSSQDIKPRHTARRIRLKNSVLLLRAATETHN